MQDILFENAGYTRLDGKTGTNNGLDGLYIKGTIDDPLEIIIGEAKQWGSSGGASVSAANASTELPQQMSDDWIQNVANRILDAANKTGDEIIKKNKIAIADMLTLNRDKISKVITLVNKDSKQINILKLGNY